MPLSQARALEVLRLDPETGVLTWRVQMKSHGMPGKVAGWLHKAQGYRWVGIDGKKYKAHLVIWLMLYGEWCPRKIDHKDLDRSNNRPSNLRKADESQQHANMGIRSDNTTGERGVHLHRASGLYVAEVEFKGKRVVKYYNSISEAAAAARALRKEMFGEFAPAYDSNGGN